MGEVYRARDKKLGRDVALKLLPEAFANDSDRLMRFEREARTLASLNHPHIANIYGIEDSGSTRALVMELVEGKSLDEKIAASGGRGLPLDEALPMARQMAEPWRRRTRLISVPAAETTTFELTLLVNWPAALH
jgi:serine/threonine-protein kinase